MTDGRGAMIFRVKFDPGFDHGARMNAYVIFAFGFAMSNEWVRRCYFRLVVCNAEVRIGWWERGND